MLSVNLPLYFILNFLKFLTADSFKLCHKTDPNINECLRGNIEDAIRNLKNGAPEVGLSTFEPLHITQLIIGEGKGPVNVQQNFNDVKLHGLTGSKVLKAGLI